MAKKNRPDEKTYGQLQLNNCLAMLRNTDHEITCLHIPLSDLDTLETLCNIRRAIETADDLLVELGADVEEE